MTTYLKSLSVLLLAILATETIARPRRCRSCLTAAPVCAQPSFTSAPTAPTPSRTPMQPKSAVPAHPTRSSGNVMELQPNQNLDPILDQNPNTVLYFYGTHCEPCHWMRPKLEAVIPEYPQLKFVIINVDNFPLLQVKYHIKGYPSLITFKNGKQIVPVQDPKRNNEQYEYFSGPRDENEIRTVLDMIYSQSVAPAA